jgi:hypothetical protein
MTSPVNIWIRTSERLPPRSAGQLRNELSTVKITDALGDARRAEP